MKRLLLIALTAAFLAPSSASAQQPYFYSGIPNDTEYLKFIKGSGVAEYGVQVGPYLAQFGTDPANPNFSIYCVDYLHSASSGNVFVTALSGNLDNRTRLGNAGAGDYLQAAYLASLFDTEPTANWGEIHVAIWEATSGYTGSGSAGGFASTTAPGSFTGSGWYVVTPTNFANGGGQEFLIRTSVPVPEPSTLLLLGTGMVFFFVARRRRLDLLEDRS